MNPIPLEQEDPELGELLKEVVTHNSKVPKKDRIVVDFINEKVYPRTIKATKVGRNEPCPCGSNKKFKKCCGK
jgi:uncharacterized protein YecA (UPF0149 family)